jgi:antitoxin HicB
MIMKQKSYTYSVVLTPDEKGGFTVTVPSIPGCITEGDTFEEALINAKEAIELCIEDILERGEEIPREPALPVLSTVTAFPEGNYA